MQEGGRRSEGGVGMEADTEDRRRSRRLGEEEGGQPTESGNSKETDSSPEPPVGMQPCLALIFIH